VAAMIIKAGTILTTESGEYSDFGYDGPFVVLKDLDQKTVTVDYIKQHKPKHPTDMPDKWGFLNYLSVNKYISEDLPKCAWYLGGYEFEPQIADE